MCLKNYSKKLCFYLFDHKRGQSLIKKTKGRFIRGETSQLGERSRLSEILLIPRLHEELSRLSEILFSPVSQNAYFLVVILLSWYTYFLFFFQFQIANKYSQC